MAELPQWPRAYGTPAGSAVLKRQPQDFAVEEILDVDFSDDGEFDWLWVEKRGETTENVARKLARHAGVAPRQVSWSGLKDRQAVTRQWFSVHLPGKPAVAWSALSLPTVTVLQVARHRRKLRMGTHRRNRFELVLRELDADPDELAARLATVRDRGFPNYFGEQRFGANGGNLVAALNWFSGVDRQVKRFQRGMYLSAVRAFLFNCVLAVRVERGDWNAGLDGDVFALRDSASLFTEPLTEAIKARLDSGDIHPTGILGGRPGGLQPTAAAAALEAGVLAEHGALVKGLNDKGVVSDRRSLRAIPGALAWEVDEADLHLNFELPKGCFATALVRELIESSAAEQQSWS